MFNTVPGQQSQSYAYEPLASERSIRTVEVRGSDKPDAELCCTLKEQDLGDGPSYEAISYAWEGQTPSHRISCDGLDLLVTDNCAEILRHFRPKSPEQSRRLWIDAICINQSPGLEKNHQVKLMCDIYRIAKRVLVWLAPSKNDHIAPYLFRWLLRICVVFPDVIFNLAEHYGFRLFKNVPWFTRLWTVQEVVMAGEALLVLGEDTLPFSAVERLYVKLTRLTRADPAVVNIWDSLFTVLGPYVKISQKLRIREQGRTPLFSFGDFTSLKVSDPKDKIFAVQGLLSALGVTLPDADYSKPLSTIYIDAYRALIAHQQQIGCLDELNRCWLVQETLGLPSWVPRDVRAKVSAGTAAHTNLAQELYAIRTVMRWIEFALSHEPVSVTRQVKKALHSCMRLGSSSDPYHEKQSYNNFTRWIEVLIDDPRRVRCNEAIGEGIDHRRNFYASLLERCRKEQDIDHLTAMEEFRILQLISLDKVSSDWQESIRSLGYMTLFKTASGKLGIGVFPIQAGDLVVYISGNHTPLCLRPDANNEEYKIAAPVYVYDLIGDIAGNENCEGYRQYTII
ncbi:Heterokaryon incompatibility protein (HET) domain containing protein [Hyaloscypha variabilis]